MAVEDIFHAVLSLDTVKTREWTEVEVASGRDVQQILNKGLIAAMDEVGTRFSKGLLFVPGMLMAARAMKAGLAISAPLLAKTESKKLGTIVIATVKGDLHDIVALSALLTTTLPAMGATVRSIAETGGHVRTMVGGAPVTQSFADKIGAGG
jgi:5-methyltetrahydrofolate--homocysteine methyltransferase